MVEVTNVMVLVILFVILLFVAVVLLSGIVPGFKSAFGNASCTLGLC